MDALYDIATHRQVAGKYINNGILLNLHAQNLDRAARHEAWHFAGENMLTVDKRVAMQREFAARQATAGPATGILQGYVAVKLGFDPSKPAMLDRALSLLVHSTGMEIYAKGIQ